MKWFTFCAALTLGMTGFAADANACCLLGLFFQPSCSGCHGCHTAPGCFGCHQAPGCHNCGGYYGCSAPLMMPSPMTVAVPVYVPQPVGCAMPAPVGCAMPAPVGCAMPAAPGCALPAEPGCVMPAEPAAPHPDLLLPNSQARPVSNRGVRGPAPFVPPMAPPASGPLVW